MSVTLPAGFSFFIPCGLCLFFSFVTILLVCASLLCSSFVFTSSCVGRTACFMAGKMVSFFLSKQNCLIALRWASGSVPNTQMRLREQSGPAQLYMCRSHPFSSAAQAFLLCFRPFSFFVCAEITCSGWRSHFSYYCAQDPFTSACIARLIRPRT